MPVLSLSLLLVAGRMSCDVAVDAMCGVGGNAVQLAGTCGQVIAYDTNLERLLLARHNAAIYGVERNVDFVCADFLRLALHCQVQPCPAPPFLERQLEFEAGSRRFWNNCRGRAEKGKSRCLGRLIWTPPSVLPAL